MAAATYVTQDSTFEVTVIREGYRVSDVTGEHLEDVGVIGIYVNGVAFTNWPDAIAHINREMDKGDWENE
jgi:hypothetical protein